MISYDNAPAPRTADHRLSNFNGLEVDLGDDLAVERTDVHGDLPSSTPNRFAKAISPSSTFSGR